MTLPLQFGMFTPVFLIPGMCGRYSEYRHTQKNLYENLDVCLRAYYTIG
jgi:hypothetical protein